MQPKTDTHLRRDLSANFLTFQCSLRQILTYVAMYLLTF